MRKELDKIKMTAKIVKSSQVILLSFVSRASKSKNQFPVCFAASLFIAYGILFLSLNDADKRR